MTHFLKTYPTEQFLQKRRRRSDVSGARRGAKRRPAQSALRALDWAASFYARRLKGLPRAHPAWLYLKDRGIGAEACRRYHIGFAPGRRKLLLRAARGAGFSAETLLEAGLLFERGRGRGYVERLHGRLTFPIQDEQGSVVGFGARLVEPSPGWRSQPRYVNTPNTSFFMKGRSLFGLEQAQAIEHNRVCILVEGYADAVALSACGLTCGIAVGGNALTEVQARKLALALRSHERPARALLAFDADAAGQFGMLRALPLLLQQGITPEIVQLPEGEDLADIAGRAGHRGLLSRLRSAQTFTAFMLDRSRAGGWFEDPATYAEAIRDVLSFIRLFPYPEGRYRLFLQAFAESRRYGPRYAWTTPEGEAHRFRAWCAAFAALPCRKR